jgi:hypothetical protein
MMLLNNDEYTFVAGGCKCMCLGMNLKTLQSGEVYIGEYNYLATGMRCAADCSAKQAKEKNPDISWTFSSCE